MSQAVPPRDLEWTPQVSVVTTVLNERKGIRDMLDSIVLQRVPHEVVVVDAGSTDGTWAILQEYARRFPHVRPVQYAGRRGAGRNMGVRLARAPVVAFTDGDCIANAFWLEEILKGFDGGAHMVAGRTTYMGYWAFTSMHRVELPHKGTDVTWPSCNLAFRRDTFLRLGGFDERFVTAEDIDLNFRAIDAGAALQYNPRARIYAQARDSVGGFLRQAYWNGYGRKQLTLKHGRLWGQYSFRDMLRRQSGLWAMLRMAGAVVGYVTCKRRERAADYRDASGTPTTANAALSRPFDGEHRAPLDSAGRPVQVTP